MTGPPPNVARVINSAARRWNVSPVVLSNLLRQESGYQEGVTSPAGARDIAQFEPGTARAYGVTLGDNRVTDDIFGAAHYLADNLRRTGGSYPQALSIYNSGSPTGYLHIPQTENYVKSILGGVNPGKYTPVGGSGSVTPGQITGGGFNPGNDSGAGLAALLAQMAGQPQAPVQTMPLTQPQASADRYLRTAQGTAPPLSPGMVSTAGQPKTDVSTLLQALSQQGQSIPQAQAGAPTTTGGGPAAPTGKGGIVNFAGKPVAGWIAPILSYARAHGWSGTVTSGYRTYQQQAQIYNSGRRPAAKPGTSNHEMTAFPGGAIDVTDAAGLARIIQSSPYRGKLVWAGAKDPVHFSHPRNGSY